MMPWLILPVKSLALGKGRLAGALGDAERHRLNTELLRHMLRQAAQFPGLGRTLVVTSCREVEAFCRQRGCAVLRDEPGAGLNAALCAARRHVAARHTGPLIAVSCDLPLAQAADLEALACAAGDGAALALASDHLGLGTNALCLPARSGFRFRFGAGSALLHRAEAARAGLAVVEVERRGLAFDLDTPVELYALRYLAPGFLPWQQAA